MRRFDGGGVKTTATIELSGPVRCLIVYSGVPRAPTAQSDEKFGTRPTAFKLLRAGEPKYREQNDKPAPHGLFVALLPTSTGESNAVRARCAAESRRAGVR
jgi:hypothetical protein